jgi:hypothetical protein
MAGAGNKLFTSGSVLTASDVNTYLMDQTIMRFTSTTTRDAAFGGVGEATLAEGMFAYTTDTNTLWLYDGSNWVNVLGSDIGAQALTNRNVIINGAMQIAQRGTSTASITLGGYYTADRFAQTLSNLGTWTQSVENDAPTGSGFRKSLKVLCTTADASPAAGDITTITQLIEGQNVQQFAKGTSSAKQFSVSFWVKSNVTGTYIVNLYDVDNTRSVSASYTISASATWEKKTITFPADTTGAFDNDNGGSLYCFFTLGAGSNFTSGTLNTTWQSATDANRMVGQTNLAAATNNYWQITGVQLEAGAVATPFEFEDYGVTLAKCQRYFYAVRGYSILYHAVGDTSTNCRGGIIATPVTMRAVPTLTQKGTLNLLNSNLADRGVSSFDNIGFFPGGVGFNTVSVNTTSSGEFLFCQAATSSDGLDVSSEL